MNYKQLSGFIAGPGGFLLLVFFFLPWISVSCSGNTLIEASGMDLATGIDESDIQLDLENMGFDESMFEDFENFEGGDSGYGDLQFDDTAPTGESFLDEADPKLWVIPLIALAVMGWAAVGIVRDDLISDLTGIAFYIVPSLIGLVIMILKFIEIEGDRSDLNAEQAAQSGEFGFQIVSLNYEFGWWITGLSLLAIFAAGAMIFLGEGQASPKAAAGDLLRNQPTPPPPPTLSAEEMKARFAQARTHIEAKQYNEARAILKTINHPTALKWLQKIDELDPFPDPFE